MGAHPADDLDPKVSDLIRHKAKMMTGSYGFTRDDEEDLCQELVAHVIQGMRQHDPQRASQRTFADRIITSKLASIIQHATAKKRNRRRERSIDQASELPEPDGDRSREQIESAMDVRQALECLPADLRQIAQLFSEHTEAEVIRRSGYSREQVRRMCRKLQMHFRAMGLAPNSQK
jgi:RNA polymerase sigma factor (sigma-70 family)